MATRQLDGVISRSLGRERCLDFKRSFWASNSGLVWTACLMKLIGPIPGSDCKY